MQKRYGIIGSSEKNPLIRAMHQAAFEAEKIKFEFEQFELDLGDPDGLANFCYETDLNKIAGFAVTGELQTDLMDFLDYHDPLTKKLGFVNTVKNEDSNLNGYNSKVTGLIQALKEETSLKNETVLVMGVGIEAETAIYACKEFGAEVFVWSQNHKAAESLAENFDVEAIDFRRIKEMGFDVIINGTTIGASPQIEQSLLTADQIKKHSLVVETIFNPLKTQLIREAQKAEAEVITADRILLHETAGQFEVWLGKTAPFESMEKALHEEINSH